MRSAVLERSAKLHVRSAGADDAEDACAVIRRSIEDLCHADHGHKAAILDRWLTNKTPENVAAWIARPTTACWLRFWTGARERGHRRCHLLSTETAYRFYVENGYRVDRPPEGKFCTRGSHPMSKDLPA